MVMIVRRGLDVVPGDELLSGWRIVPRDRFGLSDVVAVGGLPDLVRIYRVAVPVAAALVVKDGIGRACVPIMRCGAMAGEDQAYQADTTPRLPH